MGIHFGYLEVKKVRWVNSARLPVDRNGERVAVLACGNFLIRWDAAVDDDIPGCTFGDRVRQGDRTAGAVAENRGI